MNQIPERAVLLQGIERYVRLALVFQAFAATAEKARKELEDEDEGRRPVQKMIAGNIKIGAISNGSFDVILAGCCTVRFIFKELPDDRGVPSRKGVVTGYRLLSDDNLSLIDCFEFRSTLHPTTICGVTNIEDPQFHGSSVDINNEDDGAYKIILAFFEKCLRPEQEQPSSTPAANPAL